MSYYTESCIYCGEDIRDHESWGVVPGCGYAHLRCPASWYEFGYCLTAVPEQLSS